MGRENVFPSSRPITFHHGGATDERTCVWVCGSLRAGKIRRPSEKQPQPGLPQKAALLEPRFKGAGRSCRRRATRLQRTSPRQSREETLAVRSCRLRVGATLADGFLNLLWATRLDGCRQVSPSPPALPAHLSQSHPLATCSLAASAALRSAAVPIDSGRV